MPAPSPQDGFLAVAFITALGMVYANSGRDRSGGKAGEVSLPSRDRSGGFPSGGPSSDSKERQHQQHQQHQQQLAVRGIKNLGNTCFLNAVLQSLGSFPIFREYLECLKSCWEGRGRTREPRERVCFFLGTQDSSIRLEGRSVFTCELLNLMELLKPAMPPTPRVPPIVPTELRKILKDRVDIFGNQDQQDAQELFQMVMRLLGEEAALCLKNRDKTRRGEPTVGGAGGLRGFKDLMDQRPKVCRDLPENPLLGSLVYLRHCRGCKQKSGRLERFVDLSLTLPEARNQHVVGPGMPSAPVTLEKVLEDFTQQQLVEDVECPKCAMRSAMEAINTEALEEEEEGEEEDEDEEEEGVVVPPKRVRADMRMLLATPPKTLCLHFPRRHQSSSGSEVKLKQRVIFPAHLNVAPFCYAGGCHTDSIGVSTTFQMKNSLANSLPHLPPGRTAKAPPAASPPLAKALQSPQPHPRAKQALVGGSVDGAHTAAGRKELNGLGNGGARAGGSSVSGSVEGRESVDGSLSGNDGGMDYDLRAVIVHRGSADSGHYTAFRKLVSGEAEAGKPSEGLERVSTAPQAEGAGEGTANDWVYVSDEEVERVSERKVLNSQAYMLFYRQRITEAFHQGVS
ncbi:unnamed protein product [Scytosiphon promiscuus]